MKKQSRGDARSGNFHRARASVSNCKARVLYFTRFNLRNNLSETRVRPSKAALSTLMHKESKFALLSFVIPLSVLSLALVGPMLTSSVDAATFSEGAISPESLVEGTLVSLITTEPVSVEAADVNTGNYLAGVVVTEGSGLIVSDNDDSTLYIATEGVASTFVSDVNGEVKAGDFIGASWIKGVGMKVLEGENVDQKVIGVALQDLNVEENYSLFVEKVETLDGDRRARVGKISIKLFPRDIGPYFASDQQSGFEEFASKLAGKDVSFIRIIAAMLLFGVSVAASALFMTNAIRGSLNSIGRNPLASHSIISTLTQISTVSIGLIIFGAAIAYVVLVV